MGKKNDNNLILCEVNGEKHYFTSGQKAAEFIGTSRAQVMYYINSDKFLKNFYGEPTKVSLIDGSEIKYKYINN